MTDTESMSAGTYQLREIPLSDFPRLRKIIPTFPTWVMAAYVGGFEEIVGHVVALHARGTYDLAKELYKSELKMYLERDRENEHDENAVAMYFKVNGTPELVGYVDRETARIIAPELDAGAKLEAKIISHPRGGRPNRGGSAETQIYRVD